MVHQSLIYTQIYIIYIYKTVLFNSGSQTNQNKKGPKLYSLDQHYSVTHNTGPIGLMAHILYIFS